MKLRERYGGNVWLAAAYFILRLAVIGVMVAQVFNRDFQNVFLCVLTLLLFTLPGLIERRLNIDVPDLLEVTVLLFIFAAEILGEISAYYIAFPHWDTMLHTLNGFLAAAIGFSLVDLLNKEERVSLSMSPFFMAVLAFCFSMTIGVLWEFFEYGMDRLLLLDMQKDTVVQTVSTVLLDGAGQNMPTVIRGISDQILVAESGEIALGIGGHLDIGLVDTMQDLFVNFIGAAVFSIFGYYYVKKRGKNRFVRALILRKIGLDQKK